MAGAALSLQGAFERGSLNLRGTR